MRTIQLYTVMLWIRVRSKIIFKKRWIRCTLGMLLNIDKTKLMLTASRQKRNSLIDSDSNLTYNDFDLNNSTVKSSQVKQILFGTQFTLCDK